MKKKTAIRFMGCSEGIELCQEWAMEFMLATVFWGGGFIHVVLPRAYVLSRSGMGSKLREGETRSRCSQCAFVESLYFSELCFFDKFFLVFWYCVHYKGEVNQKGVNCEAKKDRNRGPRGGELRAHYSAVCAARFFS